MADERTDTLSPQELESKPYIPQVFRDSERNSENILYHTTPQYSAEQGGLDPKKSKGDGVGYVWFRGYGPHSTGGNQILAIDKTQLDPSRLRQDDHGYWFYDKLVPSSAILDLGQRPEKAESIHDLIFKAVKKLQEKVTIEPES